MKRFGCAAPGDVIRRLGIALCAAIVACTPAARGQEAPLLEVKRFVVEGQNPLSAQETQATLDPYLGTHRNLATLEAAAGALEKAMRERGYAFHRVIVPAQRPLAGEVKLQILQFPIAEVPVTGNRHFSSENIRRSIPGLRPGQVADVALIGRQMDLANEHPAKRLTVQIKQSAKRDHVDAEIRARDAPSAQTFVALTGGSRDADNTVNRNTGYARLTVGHQQSNLFDQDHALTLAYTTSPDHIRDVTQLGLFYWLPLYGAHTSISGYWTRSDVNTGSVGVGTQSFDVSGRGEFWGLKAAYALPKAGTVSQHVALGFDDRYFESSIGSEGTAVQSTPVGSRPVTLRYLARAADPQGGIGGYVEYAANTGGGSRNDDASYADARAGAARRWTAWRYGLDANYSVGGWNLVARLRGQHTRDALIPGEQFGLGGIGSVRGLRDRETAGDKGYTLSLEAHAPALKWDLAPYAFLDAGQRKLVVAVAGSPGSESAASAGIGARWSWEKRLDVDVSLAAVLNGLSPGASPATDSGHAKLYFSLFYRF